MPDSFNLGIAAMPLKHGRRVARPHRILVESKHAMQPAQLAVIASHLIVVVAKFNQRRANALHLPKTKRVRHPVRITPQGTNNVTPMAHCVQHAHSPDARLDSIWKTGNACYHVHPVR